MRVSSSSIGAAVVGIFIVGNFLLVVLLMPPPWPCMWDDLAQHPRRLALLQAARAACAGSSPDGETTLDLRAVWKDDWERLVLLRPYHGNREVLHRVGLHPAVMACTRSRIADEWTQGVLLGVDGVIDFFDLSSYLLDEYPASIDRGGAIVSIRCSGLTPGME